MGIADSAVRMALSRMVAAGDLVRTDSTYTLAPRLVERQRRQDEALTRPGGRWDGRWQVAVVTTTGSDAPTRAHLRSTFGSARFGPVRDGVWARPNNLRWQPPADVAAGMIVMDAEIDATAAGELASSIFDLSTWSRRGFDLLERRDDAGPLKHQVTVAAAIVRHLTTDPLLPQEIEPAAWPADELRASYAAFRDELIAVRGSVLTTVSDTAIRAG